MQRFDDHPNDESAADQHGGEPLQALNPGVVLRDHARLAIA
jgi:hypothetical protein